MDELPLSQWIFERRSRAQVTSEGSRAASGKPLRPQRGHLSTVSLSKISTKKEVDGHPASRKQVTFQSTFRAAKNYPGKSSVRISANLVSKGIHTPCLRCDKSQDLNQLRAFSRKTVNEAMPEVAETWNSILSSSIQYWAVWIFKPIVLRTIGF